MPVLAYFGSDVITEMSSIQLLFKDADADPIMYLYNLRCARLRWWESSTLHYDVFKYCTQVRNIDWFITLQRVGKNWWTFDSNYLRVLLLWRDLIRTYQKDIRMTSEMQIHEKKSDAPSLKVGLHPTKTYGNFYFDGVGCIVIWGKQT